MEKKTADTKGCAVSSRALAIGAVALGLILACLAAAVGILWVTWSQTTPTVVVAVSTSIPTAAPTPPTPSAQPVPTSLSGPPLGTVPPTLSPSAQPPFGTSAPPTVTPVPTATATPTKPQAAGPSPTKTKKPKPTATPWIMNLRADLPPMELKDWPRPAGDNGWGMHFIASQYYTPEEVDKQVARLVDMRIKWALVIYGDENMLRIAAPRFRDAGIMVVWRRMLRASSPYYDWGRDIGILAEYGMPPYMQVYNEPNLDVEWDDDSGGMQDYEPRLLQAAQDIYNAGGYVGLQFVAEDWLAFSLRSLKAHGGERIFKRMFFIPHPYGLNHPPEYDADVNAVLGFLPYARVFQEEIGFVPPMIAGEGGWAIGSDHDANYPKVTAELHRDYYVALFSMFNTGVMPNGDPLPDYFFAFCPWLLADMTNDSAFFDSYAGPRTLTIDALKAIPPFERKFSWSK
jgi:hypothetical protein